MRFDAGELVFYTDENDRELFPTAAFPDVISIAAAALHLSQTVRFRNILYGINTFGIEVQNQDRFSDELLRIDKLIETFAEGMAYGSEVVEGFESMLEHKPPTPENS
jgi:hypothetical protein